MPHSLTSSRPNLSPHSTGCSTDWTSEPAVEEEEVMHGSQAQIPHLQCTPASGQNFEEQDQLLWDPNVLPEAEVENFLRGAAKYRHRIARELTRDRGIVKDDEQALYELQRCGFHTEEALRRLYFNVKVVKGGLCAWDEDELRKFEQGFRIYGKNFHLIQANKVQTRSVGECVQCYYSWKKSKRYKLFSQSRLGRRKLGNTVSVECESDTLESNSLFGLQESAISSNQYIEASADGRNNKPHCDSSCMKDQCTCKVGTLSGPSFENNQETSSLTGDLNTFDFSTQGLPLLSGLMGPDLPLSTFSKVDRALPDYLSAPSMLCTASMTH